MLQAWFENVFLNKSWRTFFVYNMGTSTYAFDVKEN